MFAHNTDTRETCSALAKDWRMARVKLRVDQGDIINAISRYTHETSPDVILIETHTIDESFTAHLEALANVCAPETAAVFIGPQNDIGLYRHLLAMGATDYLVRPVQPQDLLTVLNKALQHKIGTGNSCLITVMGSKGGVGTSRIAQGLAQALSENDERTSLWDCGGSWNDNGSSYGLEALSTLRDLATLARTQAEALDELQQTITSNLSWLAASGDPLLVSTLGSESFEAIADAALQRLPNVVVDLSQSSTGIRGMAFAKAHHIVLVTTATPMALRNTRLLLKEIHGLRGVDAPVHLVINQRGILAKEEMRSDEITKALNITPVTEVTYQPDYFARLDTLEGKEFLHEMKQMMPLLAPLVRAITGKAPRTTIVEKPSLLQRLKGAK